MPESRQAADRREYKRLWAQRKAARERGEVDELWICDVCNVQRRTEETLRVHKAIAHPK